MSTERYRDLEPIAQGGMGEVFRATMISDAGVEKRVALKLLHAVDDNRSADDNRGVARDAEFLEEAKIAMAMSHGNIVQTFDAGHRDGRPFLAMELVDGTDLSALIARGPIPVPHALTIAAEALRGLDYAHRLRSPEGTPLDVVHRDISPANLLVSNDGEVKVADFGIARTAALRQQERGVRGKLAYMAPEQLSGGAIDARADLYAMGVVLFEMLTGERPFQAADANGLRAAILAGDAEMSNVAARTVIEQAMALDAADRFESAAQMREAIEDAAREAGERLSTNALRNWMGAAPAPASEGFDARLGALLGGSRTGTVEVEAAVTPQAPQTDSRTESPDQGSTRSYTGLVVLALLVAAAMPFVGFAFDDDEPRRQVAEPRPVTMHAVMQSATMTPEAEAEPVAEMVAPSTVVVPMRTRPRMRTSMQVEMQEPVPMDAAEVPPRALGELWIASEPWAFVDVDGQRIGRTTIRGHSIEPGSHEVVLFNPDAQLQRRIRVEVRPGERKRLSVNLSE